MTGEEPPEHLCSGVGSEPVARTGVLYGSMPMSFYAGFGVCPVCRLSVSLTDHGAIGDHKPV